MNKFNVKSNAQSGFTLIELIVVIVILGILAATALPKFSSLSGEARYSSLKAAKGALSAASAMAHAKYLVSATGPLTTLNMEGATINFPVAPAALTGYPKADAGLQAAAGVDKDYAVIMGPHALDNTSPHVPLGSFAVIPATIANTPTALKCYVIYSETSAANTSPVIDAVGNATDCE